MGYKAENIRPYNNRESKTGQVRQMFDSIAPAYDFMNRAMTFGIDILWRKKAVGILKKYSPEGILDVATGTGDLVVELYKSLKPDFIIGIDLSEKMLEVAKEKIDSALPGAPISFEAGDCLRLRFNDNEFDAVTVAYGVRNFENLEAGYSEMFRVLKKKGVLCIIELSTPINKFIYPLYRFYTHVLIPFIGRMVSKDKRAYSYLPESIAAVPQREEMLGIMKKAGFGNCRFISLTFGTCMIYTAVKE